jgi:hypothetical protein
MKNVYYLHHNGFFILEQPLGNVCNLCYTFSMYIFAFYSALAKIFFFLNTIPTNLC